MQQHERYAVVTGHTRGLGAALARELAARGLHVFGLARSRSDDASWLAGQACVDLADTTAVTAWLQGGELARWLGDAGWAVLVNNAGSLGPVAPPGKQGARAIAQAIALNVTAPLLLADAFVAACRQGGERRIAHVSSGASHTPYAGWSVYCATKAALDQHARAAALDLPAGHLVASIAPGVIDTAMQAQIRATPVEHFPNRARFDALKRDGALWAPEAAARRMADFLLSARFGEQAVVDLRAL